MPEFMQQDAAENRKHETDVEDHHGHVVMGKPTGQGCPKDDEKESEMDFDLDTGQPPYTPRPTHNRSDSKLTFGHAC